MKFILYCICGGLGVSTDYLIYYFSISFGVWYQFANVLGYFAGTLLSFFLNRKITFGVEDRLLLRLLMFVAIAFIGFSASAMMLYVMVDLYSMDPRVAKIVTLPFVVLIQFFLNRRITFGIAVPQRG